MSMSVRVISEFITVLTLKFVVSNQSCYLLNYGDLSAKLFLATAVLKLSEEEHPKASLRYLCGTIHCNLMSILISGNPKH